MQAFLIIVLSSLMLSCAMGPDYKRPQTDTEDRFRMADGQSDLPSLANLPWWELLRDEQLQQLIRMALAENYDLQRAVATVDEFRARALVAQTDWLPQITAAASLPAGRKANFLFPGFASPFNYYTLGNLAWEIDLWGRIRAVAGPDPSPVYRVSITGLATEAEPSAAMARAK